MEKISLPKAVAIGFPVLLILYFFYIIIFNAPLNIFISESPDHVSSGGISKVNVHVTSGDINVSGADVSVSVTGGNLSSGGGLTDVNGDFKTNFTAPAVTTSINHTISAIASMTGYTAGSGSDEIAVNTRPHGLIISNVVATSVKTYIQDTLAPGKSFYIDRNSTFTSVPTSYKNLKYIKSANDDRYNTASTFLQFDVNTDVTVYVAYDDRISPKVNWLSTFTDTGDNLVRSDGVNYSIYSKTFPAGHVSLGGNSIPSGGVGGMYIVVAEG